MSLADPLDRFGYLTALETINETFARQLRARGMEIPRRESPFSSSTYLFLAGISGTVRLPEHMLILPTAVSSFVCGHSLPAGFTRLRASLACGLFILRELASLRASLPAGFTACGPSFLPAGPHLNCVFHNN